MPQELLVQSSPAQTLRYGENPHQRAGLYGKFDEYFEQLHGKALSYNNILDATAAANLICEFWRTPTLAILKHTNPCGMGQGTNPRGVGQRLLRIIRPLRWYHRCQSTARRPVRRGDCGDFSEVIIAPDFSDEAAFCRRRKPAFADVEESFHRRGVGRAQHRRGIVPRPGTRHPGDHCDDLKW